MPDTKYCYPDTDILINKLDIRDLDKLHIFERKLTMLRLLELLDKPINGKFDFKHLQAIHKEIRRLKEESEFLEEASAFFAASRRKSLRPKE